MEFTTCDCPHPQCTHYGQRGFGTHLVRCGADRGIPRLLCTMCQGTFSVRQGTAYFGIRVEEPNYTSAMRALAEGNSLRGTGRIVEVDKDTVCDWVDRAGRHCRAVTTYLFDTLHITDFRQPLKKMDRRCAPAISGDLLSAVISTCYILGFRKDNFNVFNNLAKN
jgi:transposase-like protein